MEALGCEPYLAEKLRGCQLARRDGSLDSWAVAASYGVLRGASPENDPESYEQYRYWNNAADWRPIFALIRNTPHGQFRDYLLAQTQATVQRLLDQGQATVTTTLEEILDTQALENLLWDEPADAIDLAEDLAQEQQDAQQRIPMLLEVQQRLAQIS